MRPRRLLDVPTDAVLWQQRSALRVLETPWLEWYTEPAGRFRERVVYRRANPFHAHGLAAAGAGVWWVVLGVVAPGFREGFLATWPLPTWVLQAMGALLVWSGLVGAVWARTETRSEMRFDRAQMYPPVAYWQAVRADGGEP
jgi:hypothetical protein